MNNMIRFAKLAVLTSLLLAAAAISVKADSSFDVSLNTSSLSGTQILAFGFVDGDGVVDNTVTLSDFAFGGGSIVPPANYLGSSGVSGDLSGTVTMNDSSLGTALFAEEFDPGSSISFLLTTTNNLASGALTPDALAMYVCDTSFNCYSDDTSTAMLILNLTGGALAPSSFSTFGASGQVDGVDLPAPVVTTASSSSGNTPEPSSLLLLAAGIIGLVACSRANRT